MEFLNGIQRMLDVYGPMLLRGAEITMLISTVGMIVGFIIGLLAGVIRTIPVPDKSKPIQRLILKIVNVVINIYVEVFRGTPMIVQAMVIFYGVAALTGYQMDRTFAGILIVSINTGAYMTEIVRGGIISIDKGQFEGAQAIGMNHWQTMVHVVLPQAVRNILPATGNEYVINIKDTSVLSVISVTELFYQGKSVAGATFDFVGPYLVVCVVYFVLTFTVTRLLRLVETKMDGPQNYVLHDEQKASAE